MKTVKVVKIYPDAILPQYTRAGDACMDIYAYEQVILEPRKPVAVKTGIKIAIPDGYEMQIRPRSGLALKNLITMPNSPGTIDSNYRGELLIAMVNYGENAFTIEKNMRIAQCLIQKVEPFEWQIVEQLDDTIRGENGFGSSG